LTHYCVGMMYGALCAIQTNNILEDVEVLLADERGLLVCWCPPRCCAPLRWAPAAPPLRWVLAPCASAPPAVLRPRPRPLMTARGYSQRNSAFIIRLFPGDPTGAATQTPTGRVSGLGRQTSSSTAGADIRSSITAQPPGTAAAKQVCWARYTYTCTHTHMYREQTNS